MNRWILASLAAGTVAATACGSTVTILDDDDDDGGGGPGTGASGGVASVGVGVGGGPGDTCQPSCSDMLTEYIADPSTDAIPCPGSAANLWEDLIDCTCTACGFGGPCDGACDGTNEPTGNACHQCRIEAISAGGLCEVEGAACATNTPMNTNTFTGTDTGPPGSFTCSDLTMGDPDCSVADPIGCYCEGCIGVCEDGAGSFSDCICPECVADAYCSDPVNCIDDGICDPFLEGCVCADCANHPSCS